MCMYMHIYNVIQSLVGMYMYTDIEKVCTHLYTDTTYVKVS